MNAAFTSHIVGMSRDESAALLELPLPPGRPSPSTSAASAGTPGDVAFWDNRAVQHYAVVGLLAAAPGDGAGDDRRRPAPLRDGGRAGITDTQFSGKR